MTQKKTKEILALRYADAFINSMTDELDEQQIAGLPRVAQKMHKQRPVLEYMHFLKDFTGSKALDTAFVAGGLSKVFLPLIRLLITHRRLVLLPRILEYVSSAYLERKNIMHFTLESAVPLTDSERDSFVQFLAKKTGKNIQYTLKVDPSLIAGIKMYSSTLGFEHSIRQKLRRILN